MSIATQAAPTAPPHAYGPPVVVEIKVTIKALAFREADGRYSVVVPELPGCITQGEDIEDARMMAAEAAEGWLACQHDFYRDRAVRDVTEPMPGEAGA
jgi:predicted RNase H-like HicB family nuclease